MDTILHLLSRGIYELLGRFSGPLNFRLFVMPTVVTILAIRADLRDAREGMPAPLGAFLTNPIERKRLLRTAIKDIGKVFLVACARHHLPTVGLKVFPPWAAFDRSHRVRHRAVCIGARSDHSPRTPRAPQVVKIRQSVGRRHCCEYAGTQMKPDYFDHEAFHSGSTSACNTCEATC